MKQIQLIANLTLSDNEAALMKSRGISFRLEGSKYVTRVGDVLVAAKDADVAVKLERVSVHNRRRSRG